MLLDLVDQGIESVVTTVLTQFGSDDVIVSSCRAILGKVGALSTGASELAALEEVLVEECTTGLSKKMTMSMAR